jgi:type IV secretory pathway TraG/TraD family ATPase VirD4
MGFRGSDAARFQAYQTRARMGAQLWGRVFGWTVFGWIALTVYVVWRQTSVLLPQLHHQYFWRWVVGGSDWLNGPQMYRLPFSIWFWHYGIRTALIPVALGVAVLAWRLRHRLDATHIRGLKLLTPREHNRELNGSIVRKMLKQHTGIQIGTSIIPRQKECENFLITGSPGSGKSTLDRHMLYQVRDRAQTAIVLDVDSEFIQEFYDEGRGDIVLNPLDARCPFWTPWLEFRDESFTMDAEAMAASLVRGAPRTPTEEFFRDSARTLIEAIFEKATDRRHSGSIADFLALPRKEIHEALEGTRAHPLVDPHAAEQGTGIISVAANATKGFHHLPRRDQARRLWSARQWADKREGWIFLPSTEDARAAIQALQGVWLDCLVRWLMTADIGSQQMWIFVDELPAMGYQSQIEQLLTRGRKRGISTVIGFQNVAQLRAIYGRDRTVTMTSAPTTKIILRCDEAETAKWASDLLGSREIERTEMTMLAGLSNMREGVNLSARRTTEHIVTPAEIQFLKPFHGYLAVAGENRTTITIPARHLEKKFPAFIPRPQGTRS